MVRYCSRCAHILENNFIDVLNPPEGVKPLVNDGKTDNSKLLYDMINYLNYKPEKGGTLFFPDGGSYLFDKQIYLDMEEIELKLKGNQSKFNVKKADEYENLFYIVNIKKFDVENIRFNTKDVSSGTYGHRCYIEIENADEVILNNVSLDNADYGLKINFKNSDKLSEQNTVKHLVTNNVSGENVSCFMHICNIEKWDAENIKINVTNEDENDVPNVAIYLRPRSQNITIDNLQVDNCPGDVIHFNRFDYTTVGAYPPIGTVGFEDKNIKIRNIKAKNIGQLVGFNSETKDITFENVYVENQNREYGGIVHAFEGKCDCLTINNFEFRNIYKLLALEDTNAGFGTILIKNGKISGAFKGDQDAFGPVEKLILENIEYNNIDNTNNSGAIALMLYGQWDEVYLKKLKFVVGISFKRNTEVIRLSDNFKGQVHAENIEFIRNKKNKYSLNAFSIFYNSMFPVDELTKLYVKDIILKNINLYYGELKYLIKLN
ncbi:MAG: hypothetical protein E7207_04795 [Clostridium butyricum]|nr:hypothetical protein [Clostridium butyricum]